MKQIYMRAAIEWLYVQDHKETDKLMATLTHKEFKYKGHTMFYFVKEIK